MTEFQEEAEAEKETYRGRQSLLNPDAVEPLRGCDGVGDRFGEAVAQKSLERNPIGTGEGAFELDEIGVARDGREFEMELASCEERFLEVRSEATGSDERDTPTITYDTLIAGRVVIDVEFPDPVGIGAIEDGKVGPPGRPGSRRGPIVPDRFVRRRAIDAGGNLSRGREKGRSGVVKSERRTG